MPAEELIIALLFAGTVDALAGKGVVLAGKVAGGVKVGKDALAGSNPAPPASFSPQEIKAAKQKKKAEYSMYFMLGTLSVSNYTTISV